MIKNYFKIIIRNLWHHKGYATINILGLTLGLCAALSLYLIINYELSFDTFHPDGERIYRLVGEVTESTGDKLRLIKLPQALSGVARRELAGDPVIAGVIPYNVRINPQSGSEQKEFLSRPDGTNSITTVIVEPQYFDIFSYSWLVGNANHAFDYPLAVVLTESKAKKYFGAIPLDSMMGRRIIYQDSLALNVSGIVKDWDKKSDLNFTDFISAGVVQNNFIKKDIHPGSWKQGDMNTWFFLKLGSGKKPGEINSQLKKIIEKHSNSELKVVPTLQSLKSIHFAQDIVENPVRTAHLPTLYGLMGIALFILLLAIVNFINLSTAQAMQRSKEVSIRKILGSSRRILIFQFLSETLVFILIALILTFLLIQPILHLFHSFLPNGFDFSFEGKPILIFALWTIMILPILAGLYPALEISANKPVISNLSGEYGDKKWWIKKGLIVFQFAISFLFIIGNIVIAKQLQYIHTKDLGFKSNAIITIDSPKGGNMSSFDLLRERIQHLAGTVMVAKQWQTPIHENPRGMKLKLNAGDLQDFWVKQIVGNEDYIPLYDIKLIAGRNLRKTDTVNEFVINENLAKIIGARSPDDAIGKQLYWNDKAYPIVGVTADFHTNSLHEPISPLCIINRPDREGSLAIKVSGKGGNSMTSTISQIEVIWKDLYQNKPFNYRYFNESVQFLYDKDQKTSKLVKASMMITLFISCIGLFGLGIFIIEKRTKEIGIRKVLGASFVRIILMLCRDYIYLIILSLAIAAPVAWQFMNRWLNNFAYHIEISWWVFILAGFGVLAVMLFTVGYSAIKAALANPMESIRSE